MSLNQTSPPATSPVTLAEAKRHLRLEDTTEEDDQIQGFLDAAVKLIEDTYWLQLITATWTLKLDALPDVIFAPRGPLQSATIQYVDGAGATQTLSPSNYTVDSSSHPGRILPAYGYCWPSTRCHINAVTVAMVNGFGDSGVDVPQPIKQAILIYTGILYENRGSCSGDMPPVIDALMSSYRMTYARGTVA
jgi:uncharacterized phiE125 gp8 family phage protein